MPDEQVNAVDPVPTDPPLDTSVIPLGERALQRILDHVVAVGDAAETNYLEVKGPLDMASKAAVAKIAKFLLGAANRRPTVAAQHFHGYAVLVIGAQEGDAAGVPRGSEAHELEDKLRPYLGAQFPAFEFGRVRVDSEREVLFVIALPPQDGQTIFPCHKNYQGDNRVNSLEDGAIYVRGQSNTRSARAGEVLNLVERARSGGKPPIELEVDVLGMIHRVGRVGEAFKGIYDYTEEKFTEQSETAEGTLSRGSIRPGLTAFSSPAPPSVEDREEALTRWRADKAEHITKGRAHLLGVGLAGLGIRVVSRDRFVPKPRLVVTLHGCELIDHLHPDDADEDEVMEPVMRPPSPFGYLNSAVPPSLPRDYPVAWRNRGDDAEIVITLESLRPNAPWSSDQDDFVILARDLQAESVEVSWDLTEDDSDAVTSGSFMCPTSETVDVTSVISSAFPRAEASSAQD